MITNSNNKTSIKDNKDISKLIIEGIQEKKGKGIVILDLSAIETAAHEFIVCEGSSTMQVTSIADSIRDYVLEHGGVKPYNYDGYRNAEWIVIDYGDILVHVFYKEVRDHYNLEELWCDAVITKVPDLD